MTMRWVTFAGFGTLVDWNAGFAAILRPLVGDRAPQVMDAYHRFERRLEQETPHRLYRNVLTMGLSRAAQEVGVPLSGARARSLLERWGALPVFADAERRSGRSGRPPWSSTAIRCSASIGARSWITR